MPAYRFQPAGTEQAVVFTVFPRWKHPRFWRDRVKNGILLLAAAALVDAFAIAVRPMRAQQHHASADLLPPPAAFWTILLACHDCGNYIRYALLWLTACNEIHYTKKPSHRNGWEGPVDFFSSRGFCLNPTSLHQSRTVFLSTLSFPSFRREGLKGGPFRYWLPKVTFITVPLSDHEAWG